MLYLNLDLDLIIGGTSLEIETWSAACGSELHEINKVIKGQRALNVLSIFDGVGAALVALRQLGIEVNKFYTVEEDPIARSFVDGNHGAGLLPFGDVIELCHDVRELSNEKLKGLEHKIDLIIGGSPCTDMAGVKQQREGIAGANSILFFEFSRTYNCLKVTFMSSIVLA